MPAQSKMKSIPGLPPEQHRMQLMQARDHFVVDRGIRNYSKVWHSIADDIKFGSSKDKCIKKMKKDQK